MIRFLLDNEEVTVTDVPADLTVLDWLRLHRRRVGTKEGCGSGDCGACTVVVVSTDEERGLRYESINACIAFLGSICGKQLLTVESLATDEKLHPVQQAMLDEHGSQCGFCTPGFIMSMFALSEAPNAPLVNESHATTQTSTPASTHQDAVAVNVNPGASRPLSSPGGWMQGLETPDTQALSHHIDRALGGNLCRCTGYRPIKRATAVALARRQPFLNAEEAANLINRLKALQSQDPPTDGFLRPSTVEELAALRLKYPDAPLVAGATDLALEVTQRLQSLPRIVSVTQVPELQIIERQQGQLLVGAAASLTRLYDACADCLPEVADLLLRYGSDPVRNAGTLGGNLGSASPIGDLAPVLLALGAVVRLQRGRDIREVPIDDYFIDYRKTVLDGGEFIRDVRIDLPPKDALFAVHKVSKRRDDDISTVCAAFLVQRDAAGVVQKVRSGFGGMAATPKRATHMEKALDGAMFDESSVSKACAAICQDFQPIGDARASAEYRLMLAGNLLRRVLVENTGGDKAFRPADLEALYLDANTRLMDARQANADYTMGGKA